MDAWVQYRSQNMHPMEGKLCTVLIDEDAKVHFDVLYWMQDASAREGSLLAFECLVSTLGR